MTGAEMELDDMARVLAALPRRIDEIVSRNAARNPSAEALREGECAWTYADLATATDAASSHLSAAGVRPGDRVMLVGENCAALVALMFGISRLGHHRQRESVGTRDRCHPRPLPAAPQRLPHRRLAGRGRPCPTS